MRLVIALLGALFAPAAIAQVLWSGASAGMTVDQVKAAVPSTVIPERPDSLKPDHLVERLRVAGVEIVGLRFRAGFFFDVKEALREVHLRPETTLGDYRRAHLEILDSLRAKYGTEVSLEKGKSLASQVRSWTADRVTVRLVFVELASDAAILNVIYSPARDLDKL